MQYRKALDPAEIEKLDLQLLQQFKQLDFKSIKCIHTFLPILEKKEPNTFLFIDWLQQNHPQIKIIIPKTDFETLSMSNHLYTHRADLVKNTWNILEPSTQELFTEAIDLVLVPLLACDAKGQRVGYGKGFYDRFLKDFKGLSLGVSQYREAVVIDDINPYDMPLKACLYPDKLVRFN